MQMVNFKVMGYGGNLEKFMSNISDQVYNLYHVITKIGIQAGSNRDCAYMHATIGNESEARLVLQTADNIASQEGYNVFVLKGKTRIF